METSQPPQTSAAATGQHVGDLDGREPDGAQVERPPLGPVGVCEVGVDPLDPAAPEAERLDRAAAVDGLADRAGHGRVGRALPQVALGRAAQVPAGADQDRGQADDARQRGDRADEDRRDDRQHRRHRRDQRLGDREAHRPRERVDVRSRARDEIAGAGALDGRERQREDAAHEVLAQAREHLLGEDEGRAAREPRQDRLREHEAGQQRDDAVDVGRGRAVLDRLDELAEQARAGQPGDRGEPVQPEHDEEGAPVLPEERCRMGADLRPVGDREPLAHAASSLVTVAR